MLSRIKTKIIFVITVDVVNINMQRDSRTVNKSQRIPKGQSKIDNQEKLATQGTQDEEKQNITQYVEDTTIRKQTQIT